MPMIKVAMPRMPAQSPKTAEVSPVSAPLDLRIPRMDETPAQIAKGAKTPNGKLSRPKTSARLAERSRLGPVRPSPERAVAEEDVEDRTDPPYEGDDYPEHLL